MVGLVSGRSGARFRQERVILMSSISEVVDNGTLKKNGFKINKNSTNLFSSGHIFT
jgi:hypothetical protein